MQNCGSFSNQKKKKLKEPVVYPLLRYLEHLFKNSTSHWLLKYHLRLSTN